jgi:hypothetical protein
VVWVAILSALIILKVWTILIILVGLLGLPSLIVGLVMLRRYLLAPYVMLDKKLGIRASMDRSAALSKLNTNSVWGIIGVMLLIGLINIVPILGGLVSFIVGSLYSIAPALRYEQLKKLS